MKRDESNVEPPVVFASAPAAGATAGTGETTVALPRFTLPALPRVRVTFGALTGRLALATILLGTLAIVAVAASGPSVLVPRSTVSFANWESGPLHGLIGRPLENALTISYGFSAVVIVMLVAYAVAVGAAGALSMRTIVIFIVVAHAILLMSPPLQLTDMFNYLGYARLGGLHDLNPYTHVIGQELHDPVYRLPTWRNLNSPYGELFTILSYPLALLPLSTAYWVVKVVTLMLSLVFLGLVWWCARLLGRDPRFPLLFIAANPIYLVYALGGFHNDFFMLVPMMLAIAFTLTRRDRAAGAAVMVAIAVKFTAGLLLPFLLLAVKTKDRRLRMVQGVVLAGVPLLVVSLRCSGSRFRISRTRARC